MSLQPEPLLPKSGFSENLLSINNLLDTFKAWVFSPGMLFNSTEIWWRSAGPRSRPHEGLDLCYYQDRQGHIRSLNEKIFVPALYEGEIVKIEDDFLGESVYVRHAISAADNMQLYSIYGHIAPSSESGRGKSLKQGDVLGSIADTTLKNSSLPSHLHITVVLAKAILSIQQLAWSKMHDKDLFFLLDPLPILGGKSTVIKHLHSPGLSTSGEN